MSELVAIAYPDVVTARQVLEALTRLEADRAVELDDAVVVERRGDGRVVLRPGIELGALQTAGSALLGGLIGTLFLAPLLGGAIGAAAGATSAALRDLGIPDDFMRRLGDSLPAGSAALILLGRVTSPDEVLPVLSGYGGQVLRTTLTAGAEEQLRATLTRR